MEILHENKNNNSRIVKDYGGYILFEVDNPIGNFEIISFNVGYLPKEKYEWFCRVVGNEFNRTAIDSAKFAKKELQQQFKTLMGVVL